MPFIDIASVGGVVVRSPRAFFLVNGAKIPCLSASVTRKTERTTDTFSAEMSIKASSKLGMALPDWADYQPGDVQVLMSTEAGGINPVSMITGTVDQPQINWIDMTVTVSGRDKSGSLTEKRTSQKFANQKSDDIVAAIAKAHGLSVSATAGKDNAGKLYDQDTNHLVLNNSDHEILSGLAEREGFRWYVDGSTLYFEPRGTDSGRAAFNWVPPGGQAAFGVANFTDLTTSRNMTAAKPHTLKVQSWNHRDKQKYTGTASVGGVGSDHVAVEHHHNGKSQAQSDALAQSRLSSMIRHDCNITIKAPLDLTVDARQTISLTGTGTIYDQSYDVDSVEFDVNWSGGGEMTIQAKSAKAGR